MSRSFGKARSFWSEDRALTVFLVALALMCFVVAPLGLVGRLGEIVLALSSSFLLITGVLTVVRTRRAAVLAGMLALTTMVVDWLVVWRPSLPMRVVHGSLLVVFLVLLTAIVCARVFRSGRITVHRIVGAVAVYMLLGLIWGQLYGLVELLQPGAIRHGTDIPLSRRDLSYFSFITMCTVGYGEITPVHAMARSLAMVEALIGQLFPAILIARLVSLEIATRSDPGVGSR